MMTKEEILERSRKEKKDEGTEYMMNRGRRYGVMAMSSIGMYTVTHQKKRLIAAAAGVIAGILFAITYVIHVIAK